MKTKVYFVKDDDEITAVFPYEVATSNINTMICYSHVGQHGTCIDTWVKDSDKAKPEEYKELLEELNTIGYKLEILKNFPGIHSYTARFKRFYMGSK
jgi:hypothetical protein